MLTAVIHLHNLGLLPRAGDDSSIEDGPGPILPDLEELYWSAGAFIVFALLMRFYLYPRLRKGMDARYEGIRADHDAAEQARAAASAEVADYEAQLAGVKAEAAALVDAARQTVEAERHQQVSALEARLAEQRAAAQAENEQARAAVRDQIHAAVADVASRAGELATGRRPADDVVVRVVNEVMAR